MKLQSIAREAAACREAWAAQPKAKHGVHIHHETPVEPLIEPIENRIAYILANKPEKEQALRLRLMRPITKEQFDEYQRVTAAAWAEYDRVKAPAWAEYQRVTAPARAEYQRVPARAEYDWVRDAAWAEYERVTAAAWAEYQRVTAAASTEYKRVEAAAHLPLCVPDCPFDGGTIFPGDEE